MINHRTSAVLQAHRPIEQGMVLGKALKTHVHETHMLKTHVHQAVSEIAECRRCSGLGEVWNKYKQDFDPCPTCKGITGKFQR